MNNNIKNNAFAVRALQVAIISGIDIVYVGYNGSEMDKIAENHNEISAKVGSKSKATSTSWCRCGNYGNPHKYCTCNKPNLKLNLGKRIRKKTKNKMFVECNVTTNESVEHHDWNKIIETIKLAMTQSEGKIETQSDKLSRSGKMMLEFIGNKLALDETKIKIIKKSAKAVDALNGNNNSNHIEDVSIMEAAQYIYYK